MKTYTDLITTINEVRRYDDSKTGFGTWNSDAGVAIKFLKKVGAEPFALIGRDVQYMILGKLSDEERREYSDVKKPRGTELYRYSTPKIASVGGGMAPLVAVNMDKGFVYYMEPESAEADEPKFETRVGFRAKYIRTV